MCAVAAGAGAVLFATPLVALLMILVGPFAFVLALPAFALAYNTGMLRCYHVLTRQAHVGGFESQTRCRECSYVLMGLTEPRCPARGDRI